MNTSLVNFHFVILIYFILFYCANKKNLKYKLVFLIYSNNNFFFKNKKIFI